jgi:hypothetical protein
LFLLVVNDNFSYRWNTTGITVAGIGGSPGVAAHKLNMPTFVAVDTSKTLYISEYGNNRVQKFLPGAANGTTVAGNSNGTAGSGLSDLYHPYGIAIDSAGGVYIADSWNHRIVYWGNGSSMGTRVAGTGKRTEQKGRIQSALLYGSKTSSSSNEFHDAHDPWISRICSADLNYHSSRFFQD